MARGPIRLVPLGCAAVVFALLVYLLVASKGNTYIDIALIVVAGLLALRASGLKRAGAEVDPASGHYHLDTEFEGPSEEESGP